MTARAAARDNAADALPRHAAPADVTGTCLPLSAHTLLTAVHAELEIRKSRFLAVAMPVADRAAAMQAIAALRATHADATHVCWALLAAGQSGMSDDGEPSGTAGRPIMEVLRHHELDGVLGAVVRYYGGVKLGAGGLVRAYTDAIAKALLSATRVPRIVQGTLDLHLDYADEARVRRWIEHSGHTLLDGEHAGRVRLRIRLPASECAAASAALRDLTQGRACAEALADADPAG